MGFINYLVCDTALEMYSTQNFWGYVWHGENIITYYHLFFTTHTFDFIVNNSSLYHLQNFS